MRGSVVCQFPTTVVNKGWGGSDASATHAIAIMTRRGGCGQALLLVDRNALRSHPRHDPGIPRRSRPRSSALTSHVPRRPRKSSFRRVTVLLSLYSFLVILRRGLGRLAPRGCEKPWVLRVSVAVCPDRRRPPGRATEPWPRVGFTFTEGEQTGSAALPCVNFPAERLAFGQRNW